MKKITTILILTLLLSCNQMDHSKKAEAAPIENDTSEIVRAKKTESLDTNAPCIELQTFVADIEKLNWVADTNRIKKGLYRELKQQKMHYFNERPFYPISFDDSEVNSGYSEGMVIGEAESFDLELFKGVKNIWGYFYRDKTATDWIADGVIEQWEFATEAQATKALNQIQPIGSLIFFNTNPYFCTISNKLIIFHTRAMAFSYAQKPIFEKFVQESAALTANE